MGVEILMSLRYTLNPLQYTVYSAGVVTFGELLVGTVQLLIIMSRMELIEVATRLPSMSLTQGSTVTPTSL